MFQSIVVAVSVSMIIIIACITFFYVFLTRKAVRQQSKSVFNEQLFIQEQRSIYGVDNKGTSMDDREIYVVSPSVLGL